MPLFSERFAIDTEDDVYEDGVRRTRLLQMCPMSATGLKDCVLIYGWDAWDRFFDRFEETKSRRHLQCHCYNLGGYEFSHMLKEVLATRYEWTDARRPDKGQWTCVADDKTVYSVTVRAHSGTVMVITDDMRRMGNISMKKAADAIRRERPEWFEGMDRVKEESDYHSGWLDESDPDYEKSIHYALQDVYSQAMITRWLEEKGYNCKLTAPSIGLQMALAITYCGKELSDCSAGEMKFALTKFVHDYPPLNREMQDIAERSLLGGFVWGETGTWRGTFCHADYSSSYPYEYVYGNMFHGKVDRIRYGDPNWERFRKADMQRWYVVSFDFSLKEGMLGCISGRECATEEEPMTGRLNKKIRSGRVEHRLYTETYLEELGRHYDLDIEYEEMWVARKRVGGFDGFIRYCYEKKNRLKAEGRDGTSEYLMWKLFMNGGFHGKSITRTHRRSRRYIGDVVAYEESVSDPKLCFMLGFTAMMNSRERLLRHCRMVLESGHRIMMCDTDSMVVDCDGETLKGIIGDWFCVGGDRMEGNLGRFELETDKKAVKKLGYDASVEFQEFRCWGLKRYCEIRDMGEGRLFRKSAFAGMHDEVQGGLMDWDTDGTEYTWEQNGKKTMKYGAVILKGQKHMRAENIWDEGRLEVPEPRKADLTRMRELYVTRKEAKRKMMI